MSAAYLPTSGGPSLPYMPPDDTERSHSGDKDDDGDDDDDDDDDDDEEEDSLVTFDAKVAMRKRSLFDMT
jgi:hypothetical protein